MVPASTRSSTNFSPQIHGIKMKSITPSLRPSNQYPLKAHYPQSAKDTPEQAKTQGETTPSQLHPPSLEYGDLVVKQDLPGLELARRKLQVRVPEGVPVRGPRRLQLRLVLERVDGAGRHAVHALAVLTEAPVASRLVVISRH